MIWRHSMTQVKHPWFNKPGLTKTESGSVMYKLFVPTGLMTHYRSSCMPILPWTTIYGVPCALPVAERHVLGVNVFIQGWHSLLCTGGGRWTPWVVWINTFKQKQIIVIIIFNFLLFCGFEVLVCISKVILCLFEGMRGKTNYILYFCILYFVWNIFVTGFPVKFGLLSPGRARQQRCCAYPGHWGKRTLLMVKETGVTGGNHQYVIRSKNSFYVVQHI
jgi:hypothetical protein